MDHKMTVLNIIYENKKVLFAKPNRCGVTHERKLNKWKEITEQITAMGIFEKDWKYLRDTTWQNWRKRSIEKRDKLLKTGAKKCKYDDADELIFKIMSQDNSQTTVTDVLQGESSTESDVGQAAEPEIQTVQGAVQGSMTNGHEAISKNRPRLMIAQNTEDMTDLQRQKLKAEVELVKEKVAIAKRERYKLDLELLKLEKELNVTQPSTFTLPYYMQID